jgi:hypothetical protein
MVLGLLFAEHQRLSDLGYHGFFVLFASYFPQRACICHLLFIAEQTNTHNTRIEILKRRR